MPLISFSCLTAPVKTSNAMLNKSDQSGHSCLLSGLREKAFRFSPLRMMLAMDLSYAVFIMLR